MMETKRELSYLPNSILDLLKIGFQITRTLTTFIPSLRGYCMYITSKLSYLQLISRPNRPNWSTPLG